MEAAVATFIAAHDSGRIDMGNVGDFLGESLVPEFPVKMVGQRCCDLSSAAAKFTFDGDDPVHLSSPSVPPLSRPFSVFSSGKPVGSWPVLRCLKSRNSLYRPAWWPAG